MIDYYNGTSKDPLLVQAVEAWEKGSTWADYLLFEVRYFDKDNLPPTVFEHESDCACAPRWKILPDGRAIVGMEIMRHPGSKPLQEALKKMNETASIVDMIKHAQEAGDIKQAVARGAYGNETLRFILYAQRPTTP
jgi:hypothetical protein